MRIFVISVGDHDIKLSIGSWRIGRDPDCEIRVNDESVSRRHAILRVTADQVELTDLGSRNGVLVNGSRLIGSVVLASNDRVEVGTAELTLKEQATLESIQTVTKPIPKMPRSGEQSLALLSRREREVFERLARGQTQREVAEVLGLSVKTVETYRARLGEKLGVKTRAELVDIALRAGVLR